jgi:23S rRNA (adenine2503-C2)-methyltransferase
LENQPKYRLKQIGEAIFRQLISDWSEVGTLPLALRQELAVKVPLSPKVEMISSRNQKTTKALVTLDDGLVIETVLIKNADGRNTVCVSSQVGCALGCLFCATGKLGFKRNLSKSEIVDQVLIWGRELKKREPEEKVDNIVFMGMGEPFLNYDNVMAAIRNLNEKDGFGLGARHFAISTSGIVEGIRKFTKENLEVNLAISLHAASDGTREDLMPIAKNYPIKTILTAVDEYIGKTNRRVMFEYVLIAKINDHEQDARDLAKMINKNPLYFVNLMTYNPGGGLKASSEKAALAFKAILIEENVRFTERHSAGDEIDAACGQLAGKSK